jgi:hypothetical protein
MSLLRPAFSSEKKHVSKHEKILLERVPAIRLQVDTFVTQR